jgi:hypothetical protein
MDDVSFYWSTEVLHFLFLKKKKSPGANGNKKKIHKGYIYIGSCIFL